VLSRTGVHTNERRNKLHAGKHATETLHKVCDEAKRGGWTKKGRKEMEIMSSHDATGISTHYKTSPTRRQWLLPCTG